MKVVNDSVPPIRTPWLPVIYSSYHLTAIPGLRVNFIEEDFTVPGKTEESVRLT